VRLSDRQIDTATETLLDNKGRLQLAARELINNQLDITEYLNMDPITN